MLAARMSPPMAEMTSRAATISRGQVARTSWGSVAIQFVESIWRLLRGAK